MGSKRLMLSSKAALPFKTNNKEKRQSLHVKQKRARDSLKRDERFRRKREEDKDPSLREERQKRNVPATLDRKRVWDQMREDDNEDGLGLSVDVEKFKRLKTEDALAAQTIAIEARPRDGAHSQEDEDEDSSGADSMLNSEDDDEDEDEENENEGETGDIQTKPSRVKSPSPAPSTGTNLDMAPEALAAKFPTLFSSDPPPIPKILITTSINSTLHREAQLLTTLFPHSVYIRRSSHRYGHKFSLREIASFATNRNYTTVVVLLEDQKRPTGLTIIHLEHGPTFHFSINNWIEGKKLPGHGNPTDHYPELILNNFRTPLGLLTAHLFRTLFPPQPELQGRQAVTLHNQRDYIFVRRHRYIFREKRATEKSVVGPDGKEVPGVEGIRTGLQELGPRFTLKLRRVDKKIGRGTLKGEGEVEWQWKGGMEKQRTKFQL